MLNQSLLEQALSASIPDQERIKEIQVALTEAYAEEEAYWRQRSRIQWLQEGDKNSSFFHAVTRGRRARNKFSVVENEAGQAFYEKEQIVQVFGLFYSSMFTSGDTDPEAVVREAISPRISDEANLMLIAIPGIAEVKAAVFSIHPDKAPGPDGFSAGFYQSFWDVIGEDIYQDIRSFFETSHLHPRQNETHL